MGNTLAHEVIHDHKVNDHCNHFLCFMQNPNVTNIDSYYRLQGDGELTVWQNNKKQTMSLHTSHEDNLAVTGHPNAGKADHIFNIGFSFGEVEVPELSDEESDNEEGTPTPETPGGSPMYSLVSSDGIYTAEAGTGHEANFTTNQAYSSVYWYVRSPSQSSGLGTNVETDTGDGSTTTASLTYTFPAGTSGDYVITAYVYPPAGGSVYQTSYTVTVSLSTTTTTVSAPVWSNIPSPHNLTVGDSFSLDLKSYVTGSPTITQTTGTIPAVLTLSNGVISGTVTRAETRWNRYTATNTAGTAQSGWIKFIVTAAQ